MENSLYFEKMKALAREKRVIHGVQTDQFGLREIRSVYKRERIRIDYWPLSWKVKALYMCADNDCSVAIQKDLPDEPKLFALVHELKHHYCDRDHLAAGVVSSGEHNENEVIEIGAEVFAAEYIYPAAEFAQDIARLRIASWGSHEIVDLKRNCKAKVSYAYIIKRLEHLNLISRGSMKGIQFKKLEEQTYGVPPYLRRRRV